MGYRLVGCRSTAGKDKDSSARSEAFEAAKVDKTFSGYQPIRGSDPDDVDRHYP
jgi:hypothetical protein